MNPDEIIVNLDLPSGERWQFLSAFKTEMNELFKFYLSDFEEFNFIFESIEELKQGLISQNYLEELECISKLTNFSPNEVLIANLYYDILKSYLGCTAFAAFNNETILHARNLDWHTENNILSTHSKIFNFQKNGKTVFKTIGWPGFIGTLSGSKQGKFSLTLNAVLSKDEPELATPISFLLREILEEVETYQEAKSRLETQKIASDCLILLSGTKSDQICIIERTPTRFATRDSNDDFIVVTNDYKKLENNTSENSLLQTTSCGRFDRTTSLLRSKIPQDSDECFKILKDEKVIMNITVQQMVFDNKTGKIRLIKTGINS